MAPFIIELERKIRGLKNLLTVDEATEIAKTECAKHGWGWTLPVSVNEGVTAVEFLTNTNRIGGDIRISVSLRDGRILRIFLNVR